MTHRPSSKARIPPLLARLVDAARLHPRDETDPLSGRRVADALHDLGVLALWAVPVHGVFVPNNNQVVMSIERVARAHLEIDRARRELGKALVQLREASDRDHVESACSQFQAASDEAYFYAGLAFGVTIASFSSAP